jgi:hypothetical protein
LVPFPRSMPQHNLASKLSLILMAWFLLWNALSTVGPYIDRCVPFQIMSNQLKLPEVDSNEVVETSQGWSMETGCIWAQFRVSWKVYFWKFWLCHYGVLFVDWWGFVFIESISE